MSTAFNLTQGGATNCLADWKYIFARSVRRNALAIAVQDGHTGEITETHYRLAAQIALQELSQHISSELQDDRFKTTSERTT